MPFVSCTVSTKSKPGRPLYSNAHRDRGGGGADMNDLEVSLKLSVTLLLATLSILFFSMSFVPDRTLNIYGLTNII